MFRIKSAKNIYMKNDELHSHIFYENL